MGTTLTIKVDVIPSIVDISRGVLQIFETDWLYQRLVSQSEFSSVNGPDPRVCRTLRSTCIRYTRSFLAGGGLFGLNGYVPLNRVDLKSHSLMTFINLKNDLRNNFFLVTKKGLLS